LGLSFLLIGATMWQNPNRGVPLKLGHWGTFLALGETPLLLTKGGWHINPPSPLVNIEEHLLLLLANVAND
jgi:hypothetical protein